MPGEQKLLRVFYWSEPISGVKMASAEIWNSFMMLILLLDYENCYSKTRDKQNNAIIDC